MSPTESLPLRFDFTSTREDLDRDVRVTLEHHPEWAKVLRKRALTRRLVFGAALLGGAYLTVSMLMSSPPEQAGQPGDPLAWRVSIAAPMLPYLGLLAWFALTARRRLMKSVQRQLTRSTLARMEIGPQVAEFGAEGVRCLKEHASHAYAWSSIVGTRLSEEGVWVFVADGQSVSVPARALGGRGGEVEALAVQRIGTPRVV